MAGRDWVLASLTDEQLRRLKDAEQKLGVDYLLAYQTNGTAGQRGAESASAGLPLAELSDSQVECLRGLEEQLNTVVIAYRRYS